jgi:hypothetical protein
MSGYTPIAKLNPSEFAWTILARVIVKKGLLEAKDGSIYFRTILMDDKVEGKIPAWFWQDVADEWFPHLEQGAIYEFSGGCVEELGKFATAKMKHRIWFSDAKSVLIRPVPEISTIPRMEDLFMIDFSQLRYEVRGARATIEGVVSSVSECLMLNSRNVRVASITDANGNEAQLTLWEEQVQEITPEMKDKAVRVFEISVHDPERLQLASNSFITVTLLESARQMHPEVPLSDCRS